MDERHNGSVTPQVYITVALTDDELSALSALLNIGVKALGICRETVLALQIQTKIEQAKADAALPPSSLRPTIAGLSN